MGPAHQRRKRGHEHPRALRLQSLGKGHKLQVHEFAGRRLLGVKCEFALPEGRAIEIQALQLADSRRCCCCIALPQQAGMKAGVSV